MRGGDGGKGCERQAAERSPGAGLRTSVTCAPLLGALSLLGADLYTKKKVHS